MSFGILRDELLHHPVQFCLALCGGDARSQASKHHQPHRVSLFDQIPGGDKLLASENGTHKSVRRPV